MKTLEYDLATEESEAYRQLGELCKGLRKSKGYSRDYVAQICNGKGEGSKMSKSWIQKFENHRFLQGRSGFNLAMVKEYLKFLGIEDSFKVTVSIDISKVHNEYNKMVFTKLNQY